MLSFKNTKKLQQEVIKMESYFTSLINMHEEFLEILGTKYNIDIITEWNEYLKKWNGDE